MKQLYLVLFASICVMFSFAQSEDLIAEPLIKINPLTGKAFGEAPFDVPFVVQVAVDEQMKEDFKYAWFLKVKVKRDKKTTGAMIVRDIAEKGYLVELSPVLSSHFDKVESKNILNIRMPPLPPNQDYDIALIKNYSGNSSKALFALFNGIHKGQTDLQLNALYNKLEGIVNPDAPYWVEDSRARESDIPDLITIKQMYAIPAWKAEFDKIWEYISDYSTQNFSFGHSLYFKQILEQIDCEEDCICSLEEYGINSKSIRGLNNFIQLYDNSNTTTLTELFHGLVPIDFEVGYKSEKISAIEKRLKNIDSSIKALVKVKGFIECRLLASTDDADKAIFQQSYNNIVAIIKLFNEQNVKLKKSYGKVTSLIHKSETFVVYDWVSVGTGMPSIRKAVGKTIVPDIGLCFIHSNVSSNQSVNLIRPYYGANISFGPIHKNQRPFKPVGKWQPRHAFFATIGFTAFSISEGNGLQDLFKNTNLVLGGGIRLHRGLRLTAGTIIHKREDVNPLISETSIAASPFIGLSLDMDIANAIDQLKLLTK